MFYTRNHGTEDLQCTHTHKLNAEIAYYNVDHEQEAKSIYTVLSCHCSTLMKSAEFVEKEEEEEEVIEEVNTSSIN